jgi:hypothetical protein
VTGADLPAVSGTREWLPWPDRGLHAGAQRGGDLREYFQLSTVETGRSMTATYEPAVDAADAAVAIGLGLTLGISAPGFIRNVLGETFF